MVIKGHPVRGAMLDKLRRENFVPFLAKVFETVSPGDIFNLNWHHDAIAWELSQIETGASKRLLVTMPPRQLKSIAISVAWIAWMLGRHPSMRFISVTYSDGLSADLAKMCKDVMVSDWYRAAFPRTVLRGRAPVMDFRTTMGGGRYATSTGGTLTGRGAHCIVIDDPIKPDEAYSPTIREKSVNWYKNTLLSRLNSKEKGSIILVMQRVHEEDLAGHVIEEGGWNHLNLPGIALTPDNIQIGAKAFYQRKIGVPLHPSHESLETLKTLRHRMGSSAFSSQVLQQPIPAGGLMVKRKWLGTYDWVPEKQHGDLIAQCWDTASGEADTNDYSACVTALIRGREVYVLDVFRARLGFPALLKKVCGHAAQWKIDALLIEKTLGGMALIEAVDNVQDRAVPSPIARPTTTGKEARVWGQLARFESGEVKLPKDAPWLGAFLQELLGFPKARHDDQVDALIHLLAWSLEYRIEIPRNAGPEIYDEETGMWTGEIFGGSMYRDDGPCDPWGPRLLR